MTDDRFDFDSVFGEDERVAPTDEVHLLELTHDELMLLVSALHTQWPSADIGTRLHAAQQFHERFEDMTRKEMLMLAKKLVVFHNSFHKE